MCGTATWSSVPGVAAIAARHQATRGGLHHVPTLADFRPWLRTPRPVPLLCRGALRRYADLHGRRRRAVLLGEDRRARNRADDGSGARVVQLHEPRREPAAGASERTIGPDPTARWA